MKFNMRRAVAPLILVVGIIVCLKASPYTGLGVSLVAFGLILGFSIGSSRND